MLERSTSLRVGFARENFQQAPKITQNARAMCLGKFNCVPFRAMLFGCRVPGAEAARLPDKTAPRPGTRSCESPFRVWKFCDLKNGAFFRGKVTSHPACRKISSGGLFSTPRFPRRPIIMVRIETALNAIRGGAARKV
jgi:hypothetical protein